MTDHLFYQHGDEPDAANFAQAHGTATLTSYIVSGLDLTNPDYNSPSIDVTAGVAVIFRGDFTTASPNIDPQEVRSDAAHPVEKDAVTGFSLDDGATNHIFLDLNEGVDDTPELRYNTTGSSPTPESFKIGEVDTVNDTVSSQWNFASENGILTYPDKNAIDSSVSGVRAGTTLFDRNTGYFYVVTSSGSNRLASKEYADAIVAGLDVKESMRAATDGSNIDLSSTSDPNPVDGVTLNDGDRILLKDQTDLSENGLYTADTATDPTTWTRTPRADEDDELTSGTFVFVEEGNVNLNTGYVITSDDPIDVGTDDIEFTQFSDAGQVTAGNGLSKSGDTLNIITDAIGTDELDKTISVTWTGDHTFNSTVKQQPNNDNSGDYFKVAEYASASDLPSGVDEGGIAYVQDEGTLYVEDGT